VEGNVVIGSKAYNPAADGDMTVRLTGNDAKAYSGKVESDGSFKIMSAEGTGGVLPGKYRVAYTRYPVVEAGAKPKGPMVPTVKETSEEWEVGGDKKFTLDLSKVK
jgi:hypothetical protein